MAGPDEGVRLAEIVGVLSLGTDLALGQPLELGARATLLATVIGRGLGLSEDDLVDAYYVPTLRFVGCTADSLSVNHYFGDEIAAERELVRLEGASRSELLRFIVTGVGAGRPAARRIGLVASALAAAPREIERADRAHCEVAELIATRLGFGGRVLRAIDQAFERWDGRGVPGRVRGEQLEISLRIAQVAYSAALLCRLDGWQAALATVRRRAGGGLDPGVVACLTSGALEHALSCDDPWDALLEAEPGARPVLTGAVLDEALAVCGAFADLKSTFTVGHSQRVADLAERAGTLLGLPVADTAILRRAGRVHDLGRVGVSLLVWEKPGPLSREERETMQMHAHYTDRMLSRPHGLAGVAQVARTVHERLDGSGYLRGLPGSLLTVPARVLAAADVAAALGQARPHRRAYTAEEVAGRLRAEAAGGRLDPDAVEAVLAADGHTRGRGVGRPWPDGLTAREVEVLRVATRGGTIRGIAAALGVAPKTVDTHLQHAYAKIGVSSRAAAAMYVMQHGLLSR